MADCYWNVNRKDLKMIRLCPTCSQDREYRLCMDRFHGYFEAEKAEKYDMTMADFRRVLKMRI